MRYFHLRATLYMCAPFVITTVNVFENTECDSAIISWCIMTVTMIVGVFTQCVTRTSGLSDLLEDVTFIVRLLCGLPTILAGYIATKGPPPLALPVFFVSMAAVLLTMLDGFITTRNIIMEEDNHPSPRNVELLVLDECPVHIDVRGLNDPCVICSISLMTDPVATPCGHVFCRSCLIEWVRRKAECPMCRREVNQAHIITNCSE